MFILFLLNHTNQKNTYVVKEKLENHKRWKKIPIKGFFPVKSSHKIENQQKENSGNQSKWKNIKKNREMIF